MARISFDFWQYRRLLDRARELDVRVADLECRLNGLEADMPGEAAQILSRRLAEGRNVTQEHVDALRGLAMTQTEQMAAVGSVMRELSTLLRQQHGSLDALGSDLRSARVPAARSRPSASRQPVVLVADDYEDTRECAAIVLRQAGFRVTTASNGVEAVIAAHEVLPSVIVMDLSMPVLDGIAATRLIKTVNATKHAQVVAYSASPEAARANAHFAAILVKPCGSDMIVATVERLVGQPAT
jgi:CheY-like chemotaxis protein